MSYQCRACSYAGQKFPQGICPACHSAQVNKIKPQAALPSRRSPWPLLVLACLWGYLGFAIYQKLWM